MRRTTLAFGIAALLALPAHPADAEPPSLRWLGVAGFTLTDGPHVLVLDPFASRPGMLATVFGRYEPDAEALKALLGADSRAPELARASWLLIGHSHYDHLGDAPFISSRTGALLFGSGTSLAISRGYGLPASRSRLVDPGDAFTAGPFEVRVVESRHARVMFGRVPFPGTVESPSDGPIHAFSFLLGDARGYLITHRPSGLRIFFLSSAALHAPALEALAREGIRADVLLPATMGREADYAATLIRTLRPRLVIPHHFDDFFTPLTAEDPGAPSDADDLAALVDELHAAAEQTGSPIQVRIPALFEPITLDNLAVRASDSP